MPDDSRCCEHQYRRDVESCPYCELNEAEARLAQVTEEYDESTRCLNWSNGEILSLRQEMALLRQEGRALVKTLRRERDLAEQTLTRVETERLAAVRERDEAREVAREFYRLLWPERAEEWEKEYPWLKEEACIQLENDAARRVG